MKVRELQSSKLCIYNQTSVQWTNLPAVCPNIFREVFRTKIWSPLQKLRKMWTWSSSCNCFFQKMKASLGFPVTLCPYSNRLLGVLPLKTGSLRNDLQSTFLWASIVPGPNAWENEGMLKGLEEQNKVKRDSTYRKLLNRAKMWAEMLDELDSYSLFLPELQMAYRQTEDNCREKFSWQWRRNPPFSGHSKECITVHLTKVFDAFWRLQE